MVVSADGRWRRRLLCVVCGCPIALARERSGVWRMSVHRALVPWFYCAGSDWCAGPIVSAELERERSVAIATGEFVEVEGIRGSK